MNLIYMIPFFINSSKNKYHYELEMAGEFLESVQSCDYLELIFYNQGPFSNMELATYLSKYNIRFKILGNGSNDGIVKARYIMTRYIMENYTDSKYVAEVHLDMIFTPNWEKPLIEFLENTDEPFVAPRIISCNNNKYYALGNPTPIKFPKLLGEKITTLNSFKENIIIEGFVHPVIHKLEILKKIEPYDIKFLTGNQGYEDDSLLLGYNYYIGTKNNWRPKINFNSCVYHKVTAQRLTITNLNNELKKNLNGLKAQYGAYGLKELIRIHGGNQCFNQEYNKSILNKNAINSIKTIKEFTFSLLEKPLLDNIYTSRYFVNNDDNSLSFFFTLPHKWWSRKYEYLWASNFTNEKDVCLDVGCGLAHPFKFYLSSICSQTYACDINEGITNNNLILSEVKKYFNSYDINNAIKLINKIKFECCNINNLPYTSNFFDKIYCISLLHLINITDVKLGLNELFRVLKKDGLLIITVDTPTINLEDLFELINSSGFKFKDNLITTKYTNSISSNLMGGICCFRILLTKQ